MDLPRLALPALAVVLLSSCTVIAEPPEPTIGATGPVVEVGVGPEQESVLLAAVMAELLSDGGMVPELVDRADAGAVRQALEVGDVDLAIGYTGQTWLEELGRENPPGDPRTSFQSVRVADESNGIVWLRPEFDLGAGVNGPPANATFALFVAPTVATEVGSIAQLATMLADRPNAAICVDPDFGERSDGWAALAQRYSITTRVLVEATPAEAVSGVVSGQCLVGLSTLTDGRAWAAGLVPLADPLDVLPAFVVGVQVREESLARLADLEEALRPLTANLTTAMLGTWNARVLAGETIEDVAADAAAQLAATPD